MDADPDRTRRLTEAAAQAIAAMRAGEDEGALTHVTAAIGPTTPTSHTDARELMLLLFKECSTMVSTLGSGGTAPVKMQVFDDNGEEVPIDQADPPVRTAVRTLLAEVHGDTESAKAQLDIALHEAAPAEMTTLMVQALRWTLRLSEECTARDLPTPPWLIP